MERKPNEERSHTDEIGFSAARFRQIRVSKGARDCFCFRFRNANENKTKKTQLLEFVCGGDHDKKKSRFYSSDRVLDVGFRFPNRNPQEEV